MSLKINFAAAEEVNKGFEVEVVEKENANTTEEMVEMTNTNTMVNVFEMVQAAGIKDADNIRLLLMMNKAITVEVIKAEMNARMIAIPSGRPKKIVLADLLARDLEMDLGDEVCKTCGGNAVELDENFNCSICAADLEAATAEQIAWAEEKEKEEASAASETLVAETKSEEDVIMQEVINKANMKALEKSPLLRSKDAEIHVHEHKYVNPGVAAMEVSLLTAAHNYNRAIGSYDVVVKGIEWFGKGDRRARYGRLGAITLSIPRGYMTISEWDENEPNNKGEFGAFVSYDFADFDYDQTGYNDRFAPLAKGDGTLVLAIKEREFEGGLYIGLPVSPSKEKKADGTPENFYQILKTSDVRWGKPHTDNNRNLEVALSAYVRMFVGEFEKANTANFHALKPSCMTCRYAQILGTKDGVSDDLEHAKSNRVLQQNDIPTLVAFGERTPNVYCPVFNKIMDFDGILAANKADAQDLEQVYDTELGEMRYLRKDELYIDGRIIKKADLRYEATKEQAEDCSHYHGNVYKGEARAAADRIASGNPYESAFWTDRAEVGRMVVQSLVGGVWVNKYPGEVEADAIRVVGLGGVTIYGTPEVSEYVPAFTPEVEAVDEELAEAMTKINQIFYAAFNFGKLSAEQASIVFEIASNKPELDDYLSRKWDNACRYLADTVQRVAEGEKVKARDKFAIHFFEGKKPAGKVGVEIKAASVIDDTLYRAETNQLMTTFSGKSLGYKDLAVNPREFISYLDEVTAEDMVWDVLLNGTTYYVKSNSPKDKKLVAGALQELLQRRVDNMLYDIRREASPLQALKGFAIDKEVKRYIAKSLGLKKK